MKKRLASVPMNNATTMKKVFWSAVLLALLIVLVPTLWHLFTAALGVAVLAVLIGVALYMAGWIEPRRR